MVRIEAFEPARARAAREARWSGAADRGPFDAGTPLIGESQKRWLVRLVAELAELRARAEGRPPCQRTVWSALCAELGVISYHLIPIGAFELALDFLEDWRRKLETPGADIGGKAWRTRCYIFICSVLTEIGEPDALPELLERRYGGRSPQGLCDYELDEVCRLVAQKRRLYLARVDTAD